VIRLQKTHVEPCFLCGDFHTAVLKGASESDDGTKASIIDGGPRPIENHGLQRCSSRHRSEPHFFDGLFGDAE
jgi:hypothetical protein